MANVALQNLFTLFQAGRYADMVTQARVLLQAHPDEGALWKALSVGQQMLGQDALPALLRARTLLPGDAELAANLGALWMARGDGPRALEALQEAVRLQPRLAGAHNNLGNVLLSLERPGEALAAFDAALRLQPGLAAALGNRARALLALGQHEAAAAAFDAAIAARPGDAGLRVHAATAQQAAGHTTAAVARLREALTLAPARVDAWFTLGEWLQAQGDLHGAADAWSRVLQIEPDHAEAACNLSVLRPEQAGAVLAAVLAAGVPGERRAAVLGNLGGWHLQADRVGEAVAAYRAAVDAAPTSAQALGNLAQALRRQGALDDADRVLTQLVEQHPELMTARSDRLLLRCYRQRQGHEAAALRDEAAAFGARLVSGARPPVARGGWRRRVGLVSADLRQHPVGRLAQAWLPALAQRCEVVVYSNARTDDALAQSLRAHVAGWRDVSSLDDAQCATQIAADGVDVLVDLNGHTGGHRLGVFARRPAPRQFSWLGYAGSTGLGAIDGFIGDRWLLPPGAEAGFVEPLCRLPHSFTVYAPPAPAPAVAPLPDGPCFGSFNGLHKLSDEVLSVWARVLAGTPGSRLLLKAPGLQHDSVREALLRRWPGEPSCLDLAGPGPLPEYLAAYARVDIALDPWPYSGGMTTLDGLWMGVPVLTMPGAAPISRQGLSFLQSLGLADDWVAANEDDYVRRAVAGSQDRVGLAALRASLREHMAASPLCDAGAFVEHWLALVAD